MKRPWILLLILILLPSPSATAKRNASDVLETDPMQLNPGMARFLVQQIKPDLPRKIRLNSLLNAIFSKDGLNIQYGNTQTLTAAETFESRTGNCLSFTILFVAMARHLGLHASFKEVGEVTSRDVRGELLLANYHMYAEVEIDNGVASVDFLPGADKNYKSVRRISSERATAPLFQQPRCRDPSGGRGSRRGQVLPARPRVRPDLRTGLDKSRGGLPTAQTVHPGRGELSGCPRGRRLGFDRNFESGRPIPGPRQGRGGQAPFAPGTEPPRKQPLSSLPIGHRSPAFRRCGAGTPTSEGSKSPIPGGSQVPSGPRQGLCCPGGARQGTRVPSASPGARAPAKR